MAAFPPGVKLVPYYDRTSAGRRHHRTVLHNLVFGCLLIFFIQWLFLGDLRSAIIVGTNIPFALFFSIIILVLRGEDANLLVTSARSTSASSSTPPSSSSRTFIGISRPAPQERQGLLQQLAEGKWGADPTRERPMRRRTWTDRLRLHSRQRAAGRQGQCSSPPRSSWRPSYPLFTMQGVEGQIFGPMARTYGYALGGRIDRNIHGHAVPGLAADSGAGRGNRDDRRAPAARRSTRRCCAGRSATQTDGGYWLRVSRRHRTDRRRASAASSSPPWKRATCGFGRDAAIDRTRRGAPVEAKDARNPPPPPEVDHGASPSTADRTMAAMLRRSPTSNCSCHCNRTRDGPSA